MATIATAREYFEQVVAYNLQHYKADPASLPAAYNLAGSLFSMYEWMWHTYENKLETAVDANLSSKSALNCYLQDACGAFKHIRDLANASKHVSLSSPSTQAARITDTTAIESRYGEGVYGVSKYGRGVVVINDGGNDIDFENCADEMHSYWLSILDTLEA